MAKKSKCKCKKESKQPVLQAREPIRPPEVERPAPLAQGWPHWREGYDSDGHFIMWV